MFKIIEEYNDSLSQSTEDLDFFLNEMCASADVYNESVINDIKEKIISEKQLWDSWMAKCNHFVTHRWIYRIISEKQKDQIQKHYETICSDNVYYSTYKKSFQAICKFVGLTGNIILENIVFSKDKQDPDNWEIAVKYSKGLVKVTLPVGITLIHTAPAEVANNIERQGLIPAFRSKTKGKYLYPNKRIFFTIGHQVSASKAGLENKKTVKFIAEGIKEVYIDPTYNDYFSKCVYIDSEQPLKVVRADKVKNNLKLFSK